MGIGESINTFRFNQSRILVYDLCCDYRGNNNLGVLFLSVTSCSSEFKSRRERFILTRVPEGQIIGKLLFDKIKYSKSYFSKGGSISDQRVQSVIAEAGAFPKFKTVNFKYPFILYNLWQINK